MAIVRGSYTADGNNKYLKTEIDASWIKIKNLTQWDANVGGADQIIWSEWIQGMTYGNAIRKNQADDNMESVLLTGANAITPINTSDSPLGTKETHTGFTNAAPPVVTVADATLYPEGSIVRLGLCTGSTCLQGMDFTVAANDGTHIDLAYMVAPGSACTGGDLYPLKWDAPWYKRDRYIASITQAASAVIQMTVTNEFEVGDVVRLIVPDAFGMVEADGKEVTVTAVSTDIATNVNTITVDLDTTSYTAFAWPASGTDLPGLPQVIPVSPKNVNTAFTGFKIVGGATAPGGVADDVIFWMAGDSDTIVD